MKKGGYQIIDLQNKNFNGTDTAIVYEGIYDLIEGTKKPILLSGISVGGVEYQDAFVIPKVEGSSYKFNISYDILQLDVTVTDADVVTIVAG